MSPIQRRARALRPLSLDAVRTYPLASRRSKVSEVDFARPHRRGGSLASFLSGLPRILAGSTLRELADAIVRARAKRRPVVWGLGAHVIKVGLSPVLIDLMERGFATGIATNGAAIVHDFELALTGGTSEDVEAGLGKGQFGMARETGEELGRAIVEGDRDGLGIGASVGRYLARRRPRPRHLKLSLLAAAHRLGLPATVHVAVGTDIVHVHPACDPAALGRATHLDFRLLAAEVARLGGGGVYLNVGSAVVLPEVFLKALTLARNLGHPVRRFSTANLDFLQSYRPGVNVVERPVAGHGRGFRLTGHHEILVPLVAAALVEADGGRGESALKTEGRLEEQDLPDLIQELSRERWTGTLRLHNDDHKIGIVAEAGQLVFASSSKPDYRLGPRLLRRGQITLRQMEDAGRAIAPGKRFGTVLVEQGTLAPKELVQGVVDQTRDIILLAFQWVSGSYKLEVGAPAGEAITLDISTPQLILDGIAQIEAWSRIERGCGGLQTRYAVVAGSEALFNQLTLDVDQAALARAAKRGRDVEALCAESVLNHFEVCRTLWAFRVIGLVKRLEDSLPLDEDGLEYVLPADGHS